MRIACFLLVPIILVVGRTHWAPTQEVRQDTDLSAIALASHRGDIPVVVKELRADITQIENRSFAGRTPLMIAAGKGHDDLAWLLMKLDADVHASDRSGVTALYLAAGNASSGIVESLTAAGVDLDKPVKGGTTPLMSAVARGKVENVKVLLKADADKDATDDAGRSASDYAARLDGELREEMLRVLASNEELPKP
jgi:ankyrin repeat protein